MFAEQPCTYAAWMSCALFALSQGQILDSKEFYAPIITPHEALVAFAGTSQDPAEYRLDFSALLSTAHRGPVPASGDLLPNNGHFCLWSACLTIKRAGHKGIPDLL